MAGIYLKNDKIFKSFSDWLASAVRLKGEAHFVTEHVSSFVKEKLSKKQLLECSINIFLELVSKSIEYKYINELMPMLVIPLGWSNNVCFWDDSLSLDSQLVDEPPIIYLLEREALKRLDVAEEYKIPVSLNLAKIESVQFSVYYRCYRDKMGIENNWEFSKALYIKCYSEENNNGNKVVH
jgi:hypothetical protein